jgi:hypothetical protein
MYAILFTGDIFWTNGFLSEAEAVRSAMEAKDPQARIEWSTEREDIGAAGDLWEELGLEA